MNYMKRAIQSLWAKKGRSIIMIAVFSAILIFVLAGLTIRSGADLATTNAKKSVGATVTLSTNRETMFKQSDSEDENSRPDPGSFERTPVNLSDAKKIAKLSNVKSYSFEASTSADKSSGIEPISSDSDASNDSTENTEESSDEQMAGFGGGGAPGGMSQGDFQIKGVSESSSYSEFSAGTASLVEGEAITSADEGTNNVLIEQSLAEANDLSVGDTFKIKDTDDKDVEVTIKGIYKTSDSGDSMSAQFNFMNPSNTIFSSYTMVNTLTGSEGKTIDSAVYNLEDPKDMDSFVKQANKLIDTDTFSLETNDQMYQQMLQPLNNVSSFAKNIVILVAAAGVIILTLIIMLSIRERKYEIGVLLSLGESRMKVISQFFVEIFICMIFALGIAAASGNVVGNAVGNQLLNQQTTSQNVEGQEANAAGNNGGPGGQGQMPGGGNGEPRGGGQMGGNPFTQTEEIQELNISVKPIEILSLAGIGLGISLFSIVLSSAGILRLNPKKILIS
ncbi:ABC transporter permease [Enterococcus avium]|uniref:ABC transporter permease n=1 Tax=Enterococcus avium TaxID=33945 RepID=UPI00288E3F92|nr:ABC transporter permease [Enterococcus avium]MDT2382811.1 ABC transporter permease [Enterococcus avium]MDT2387062.1 ABC transporter permease [Enterococcus avium]MDT2498337.1 ABC transporter permease [Enterococcus avium]